ncbi:zinc finger domain-containing protein [Streptosporangium saharense]|uniref:zinc finger domain-containing protein n=1 Tax=Streptosporangium saharense TaxID=1706840 RepID=UPI003F4E35DF
MAINRLPASQIVVTAEQTRSVTCPRCRARPGDPCRNQYGKAVSGGHADRKRAAAKKLPLHRRQRPEPKQQPTAEVPRVADPARGDSATVAFRELRQAVVDDGGGAPPRRMSSR